MPHFWTIFFISLFVVTTAAFSQHQRQSHVAVTCDKICCHTGIPRVSVIVSTQLNAYSSFPGLLRSVTSATNGTYLPTGSSSIDKRAQKSDPTTLLHQSLVVLWGVLPVLLCDAVPVVAEETPTYNYWQIFGLLVAPGVPMIVIVFGLIIFGFNSVKCELKADMTVLESKLDIKLTALEKGMDIKLTALENGIKSELKEEFSRLHYTFVGSAAVVALLVFVVPSMTPK
jgi:hypothetical protein